MFYIHDMLKKLLAEIRQAHFLNVRHNGSLCFNVKQLDLLNHFFFTITLLREIKRMRKKMEGMEREVERGEKKKSLKAKGEAKG